MIQITIGETTARLEDIRENAGEIVLHDTAGHNYSYFWGSMGGNISSFIKNMSPDYFSMKLLGAKSSFAYDGKGTFKNLREFIRTYMGLPWYRHMEFQKDLRRALKSYQNRCEHQNDFVLLWTNFICDIDFNLINDRYDRKQIENEFNSLSEVWGFIQEKHSDEHNFLMDFHKKLKQQLN